MPDAVVVGAGIAGLACARRMRQAGLEVLLLEAGDQPGGVVRSHRVDGYLVEAGPNTLLPMASTAAIIDAAGLGGEVVTAPSRSPRFIYVGGRLRRAPWVLSPRGALRALAEPLAPARRDGGDESLRSFFTRRFGAEVHDRLAAPFIAGIYAGDTAELGVEGAFPRLAELERRFGSVLWGLLRDRQPGPRRPLSSFREGMAALPRALARGLDIRYGAVVEAVEPGWRIHGGGPTVAARALVLAAPAPRAARMLRPVAPRLSDLLQAIWYAPIVVAASACAREDAPARGFGFLAPRGEGLHLLGTLFSSNLFPGRAPEGRALLTSFLGGALEPEAAEWPEDRIWRTVDAELRRVRAVRGELQPVRMFRHPQAIPQHRLGRHQWRREVDVELGARPGLFLAGNYLDGVSLPLVLEQGQRTGEAVVRYLRGQP